MRAEYVDHMGDDLRVVNAARVSFDKESEWEWICEGCGVSKGRPNSCIGGQSCEVFGVAPCCGIAQLDKCDLNLIKYLATHGHWTPFSHPQITLRETVPIFVARQRFKHMIGFTYNEVSRRYVDDEPEFFSPMWRERPCGSVKQGSGRVIDEAGQKVLTQAYDRLTEHAESLYEEMVGAGVAPEQARMVLPQSMYTSYYTTGSLAAWARAYKQRSDPHAQQEIQDLAKQWDAIIRPLFPVSWSALVE